MNNKARITLEEALAFVEATFATPPVCSTTVRAVPRGRRVARFVLPNNLCKPTNATRGAAGWRLGKDKKALYQLMLQQAGRLRTGVLPGRPQVICIRFSSSESDPYADWAKSAVDMLRYWREQRHKIGRKLVVTRTRGLGFIIDDKGSKIDLSQHWEPAKAKRGFTYIEVWTG